MSNKENIVHGGKVKMSPASDALNSQHQAEPQEIDELKKIISQLVLDHGGTKQNDESVTASDSIIRKVASEVGVYHQTLKKFIANEKITSGVIQKLAVNCSAITLEKQHYINSTIQLSNLMIPKENNIKIVQHLYPTQEGISLHKKIILKSISEINDFWVQSKKVAQERNLEEQFELQDTLESSNIISNLKKENVHIYAATLPMYMRNLLPSDLIPKLKERGLIVFILVIVGYKDEMPITEAIKRLPDFSKAEE